MCTMTPPSKNGGACPCGLHLAFLLPPTPAIVLKGLVVNASLSECKTGTPLSQVGSPWPGPMGASIQGLSSMSPGQLSVTPLWPRGLGKNQPMAGPGRGFEDLGRKGFCSSPSPLRLAGVALLDPTAFLSTLSKSTNTFSACQDLMAAWLGPVVAPQRPGSHASPPFDSLARDGQLWQSLPRPQNLASLAMCICSQAWLSLLPWEGTLSARVLHQSARCRLALRPTGTECWLAS